MDKPFKTIEEQIAILRLRGLVVDDSTSSVLRREGYYQVVNGYKDLFLDREAMTRSVDDRYIRGTKFSDIYRLFVFDRNLRTVLMKYFAKAEAVLKTICSYCFTEEHQNETNPYLDIVNYSKESQKNGTAQRLISDFEKSINLSSKSTSWKKKPYLVHYAEKHSGEVPLWVLTNYLTLGQVFKFYNFQTEGMRNKIALRFSELYHESYGRVVRTQSHKLRLIYDHVKDCRNIAAHDERLYCSRVSPSKDITVAQVIKEMKLVLSKEDYVSLCKEIRQLIWDIANELPSISIGLLNLMGIDKSQVI